MDLPSRELHPSVRSLWRLAAIVWVLVSIAAAVAVAVVIEMPLLASPVFLAVPLAFVVPDAMFKRWRYEIRERDVFLAHGLWFREVIVIPFDRIQFVETRQGPLDRRFGLAQVVIFTAGGRKAIPGLLPEEAERLRDELAAVAGTLSV